LGNPFSISEQPSLDGTYRQAQAHMERGVRKPLLNAWWSAIAVAIQINDDNPWRILRSIVITT
jgi:hypothetical protein